MARSDTDLKMAKLVTSSPNHPTSDIEDAFSSNFLDYIPASPDYVPASPGKTYSSSSNNSFGVVPIVSPTLYESRKKTSRYVTQVSSEGPPREGYKYRVIFPTSTQTILDAPPRLNPFGCSKLTTFIFMCKAYDCEPSVELFRGFFNLCKADTIVPSTFPQLLLKENMLDVNSFKDKLPSGIEQNPQFQHLGGYPASARAFDDPILFLVGLQSSWEHGQ
ncbi:hypothetical protein Tco_0478417 [Tanacetum coccineum]